MRQNMINIFGTYENSTGFSNSVGVDWVNNPAFYSQCRDQGYQLWTVPISGKYKIEMQGAFGGNRAGEYG